MPLEYLELLNFGKHKKLKIAFGKLLTVIQGESNSGKSTIFRGVKLVTHNRPSNPERIFNFNHNKISKFKVTLVKDKIKIVRDKKSYTVGDQILKAFGTNVPDQVKEVINLKDINWQSQILNQYNLIFDSPGSIAKVLNKEIGMEDSNLIIASTKSKISNIKGECKLYQKALAECREKIKTLEPVNKLYKEAKELKDIEDQIMSFYDQESNLSNLISKIETIEDEIIDGEIFNDFYKEVEDLELLKQEINDINEKGETFFKLVKEIENLKILDFKLLEEVKEEILELIEIEEEVRKINEKEISLKNIISNIELNKREIEQGKLEQKELENQLQQELSKMKICPFHNKKCPLHGGLK